MRAGRMDARIQFLCVLAALVGICAGSPVHRRQFPIPGLGGSAHTIQGLGNTATAGLGLGRGLGSTGLGLGQTLVGLPQLLADPGAGVQNLVGGVGNIAGGLTDTLGGVTGLLSGLTGTLGGLAEQGTEGLGQAANIIKQATSLG